MDQDTHNKNYTTIILTLTTTKHQSNYNFYILCLNYVVVFCFIFSLIECMWHFLYVLICFISNLIYFQTCEVFLHVLLTLSEKEIFCSVIRNSLACFSVTCVI